MESNLLRRIFSLNRKIYYYLAAGGLLICLLSAIVLKDHFQPKAVKEDLLLVSTKVVGVSENTQSYHYSGEVCGRYESQLSFQVSGKVLKRNVELGSVVKPGDILMQIDAKDIQQNVNLSEADVSSAQSDLRLAQDNLNRYRTLCEQGAISQADYDRYQNSYNTAEAKLRANGAKYVQEVNKLDYSNLHADRGGVIASIDVEAGQVVSAGQKVITLVEDGEREVEINVPENRLEEVRKAQAIKVSFWALPNIVIDGKVREIAPMADKVSRTYKVRISLPNPPSELRLGMTSTVMVANDSNNHLSAFIPLSAIYQTGDTPAVWVVHDNVVNLVPVKISSIGDGQVQVLEGLNNGDIIVKTGVHKLREGQKVRVAGEAS